MPGRRTKRFETKHPVPVSVSGSGHRFVAVLVDISSTGILVRCHEALEAGSIVQLIIGAMPQQAVHTMAVVRRQIAEVGLAFEFRNMSMTDRDLLRKMLLGLSSATITGKGG